MTPDPINPPHYKWHPCGLECIEVAQVFQYNLGCVIKYIWRSGEPGRDPAKAVEDLRKAQQYLGREILRREAAVVRAAASHPDQQQ